MNKKSHRQNKKVKNAHSGVHVVSAKDKEKEIQDENSENLNIEEGDNFTIKTSDYEIGEIIGKGTFACVKIAKNKKTGEYVAMKIIKKKEVNLKNREHERIANQIKILSMIQHPFIIKFYGFTQDDKNIYLALELVNGGDFFSYLRLNNKFAVEQSRFYICQIICVLDYLHRRNIIYRNLLPENILIHKSGYLKLAGFGTVKIVERKTFTLCGTPEYLAPEIVLNKGHGKPVDWWTCGILLYEMLVGIDPFHDEDPMRIYQKILEGKINFPEGFDSDAKDLIIHLLEADPKKRYGSLENGIKDIIGHKFFKGVDWNKIMKKEINPPYIPKIRSDDDTSNFPEYLENDENPIPENKMAEDPFLSLFQ